MMLLCLQRNCVEVNYERGIFILRVPRDLPSFAKENAYEITNKVRKDYNVEFAAIHPQYALMMEIDSLRIC